MIIIKTIKSFATTGKLKQRREWQGGIDKWETLCVGIRLGCPGLTGAIWSPTESVLAKEFNAYVSFFDYQNAFLIFAEV